MSEDHLRRQMEKRRNTKAKTVYEVMRPLGQAQFKPAPSREAFVEIRYIKSQNWRSKTVTVGTTPFHFDKDGVCALEIKPGRGAILYDLDQLKMMNGISEDKAQAAPVVVAAPAPAPRVVPAPAPAPVLPPVQDDLAVEDLPVFSSSDDSVVESADEDEEVSTSDSDAKSSDDNKPKRRGRPKR